MPLFAMPIQDGAAEQIPMKLQIQCAAVNALLLAANEPGKQAALGSWNAERGLFILTINVAHPDFESVAQRYVEVFRSFPLLTDRTLERLAREVRMETLEGPYWRMVARHAANSN